MGPGPEPQRLYDAGPSDTARAPRARPFLGLPAVPAQSTNFGRCAGVASSEKQMWDQDGTDVSVPGSLQVRLVLLAMMAGKMNAVMFLSGW